jgi:heptosyltransferase-2
VILTQKAPPMRRLLILRGGAVGDFVVTLPALGALRRGFPHAFIEVLGNPQRAVLAHHPCYADRITDLEAWDIHRLFSQRPSALEGLATYLRSFDAVVAYLPNIDTTFTQNLHYYCQGRVVVWPLHPTANVHMTDYLLQAVADMVPPPYDPSPRVYIETAAAAIATQFWHAARLPDHGVIALHPGSGGRHKLWPQAGWQHVMRWMAQQGLTGLMISGPAEAEQARYLLQDAPMPPWPCASQLPLPHLAALLARCQVVVGHDSGVTHLAAAVGTTTLALFGPTDPYLWGPRSRHACILQPQVPQPLTLQSLPPEAVIQTLDALLCGTFPFVPSHVPCTIKQGN